MSDSPCILFFIPPAYERLEDYCSALEAAGYEVCILQYGKASDEEISSEPALAWIIRQCPNVQAVIWGGVLFFDSWAHDESKKAPGRASKIIAKLKRRGAVVIEAQIIDWGGVFEDTVVMHGSPDVFAQQVQQAIELHQRRLVTSRDEKQRKSL